MNNQQRKLLITMKKLIKQGKRRFANRYDRNYKEDLFEIGITEYEAWNNHILRLNEAYYFVDYRPTYYKTNNTLVFKKFINNRKVYIKLKIEKDTNSNEECVCLSFHLDNRR